VMRRFVICAAIVCLTASGLSGKEPTRGQLRFFESKVRPLLANRCFKCHGPKKQSGKLRLDSLGRILRGGESGAAISPGKPEASLMIKAIRYQSLEMPPDRKLADREIKILTTWIKMGAPWSGGDPQALRPRPAGLTVTAKDRQYWAFRPVRRVPLPQTKRRVHHPIDAFIQARLEARDLQPSPSASRRVLIRRLYFDLLGLPPTKEQVDDFVSSRSPDAYEQLVDRLLASPRYGERWGRHWLDVVRYAQSNGYERDDEKPESWRFRDYVVRAFNQDKSYRQFVIEQLAGDLIPQRTDDSIIATGFFRIGAWDDEPADKRQAKFDELDDIVSTMGSAMLGLTVGCARCHDHKFDPIRQADYYRLLAFFRNVNSYGKDKSGTHFEPNTKSIFVKLPSGKGNALAVTRRGGKPLPTHILTRGNSGLPGKRVDAGFVEVLCNDKSSSELPPQLRKSHQLRLQIAHWIASAKNPLSGRVIVNRMWHYHFGRGIVATPSDFGKTGFKPTHPLLLDWLASELIRNDWHLKKLHRLIVTSHAYRQSSRAASGRSLQVDPDNRFCWRQNLRRLEAEVIRDTILQTSGRINLSMGGRGIFPALSPDVLSSQSRPGAGWGKSTVGERSRRSIYIFIKRTLGVPFLEAFDFASPDSPTAARTTTTIAPQALILLNSQFMQEQSEALAQRLLRETGTKNKLAVIERAIHLALARPASKVEHSVLGHFFDRQQERWSSRKKDAAQSYQLALIATCKVILNLNEFIYVD